MDPSEEKDYYAILGVSRTAEPHEVQEAFRRLAKRHHPDYVGDQGTRKFQQIQEAYEVLSNPDRRRNYDADLRRRREQASTRPETLNPVIGRMSRRRSRVSWSEPEPLTRPPYPERFSSGHPEVKLHSPWSLFETLMLEDFLRRLGPGACLVQSRPAVWAECFFCGAARLRSDVPCPSCARTEWLQAEFDDLIKRWFRGFGRAW